MATIAEDHDGRSSGDLPPLTADQLPDLWQRALATLSGLTAGFAQSAAHVSLKSPDCIEVSFSARNSFAKANCERPEQLVELEREARIPAA